MKKLIPYLVIVVAVIFSQCAQQTALSGGKRDTTPPMLDSNKQVVPANGSINFSAPRITIPFNEYIQLKDKDKQILITPFLETQPDIYVKGKKVIIDFNSPLEDNTTYIINFGNSIADITEGNEMVNYKYVFSTGTFIDSLRYSASVYDAYSKNPVQGVYVMLYKNDNDSILLKEKPNYFGVTQANGTCNIENIAAGTYKVLTFAEENGNYKWDPKSEKIGFTERRLVASKDTIVDTLVLFTNHQLEYKINEVKLKSNGSGYIAFNQFIPDEIRVEDDSLVRTFAFEKSVQINSSRDTVYFFAKPNLEKGEKYSIGIRNLDDQKVMIPITLDTVLSMKTNSSRGLKPQEDLYFQFSQPLESVNPKFISLLLNDDTLNFESFITDQNTLRIASDWLVDENYTIELLPGAVTSYQSLTCDTITAYFETLEENDFGQLLTTIKAPNGVYIVELLQDGKVKYRDQPSGNEFSRTYAHLFPGKYQMRLVFDENKNGLWDTGDYFEHKQPERVEYYGEPIQIKKGWDMEIQWEIVD